MRKEVSQTRQTGFQLPVAVSSARDVIKTLRELEAIDDFLYQANLRKPGAALSPPKTTGLLNDLTRLNHISLLNHAKRQRLLKVLDQLQTTAPVIHISFAAEPSADFMAKITSWLRQNVHPYVLVNVGLQPSVIVGCELRTINKIFDMSLRNKFEHTREILVKKLEENSGQ